MDRPTPPVTGGPVLRVEQSNHDRAASAVPAWHEDGRGTPELGEYSSRPFGVPASAGEALAVDMDGAHFPALVGALWGLRGQGEPHVVLDFGGPGASGASVRLRLSEAQELSRQLQALVDAAREGGAL